MSKICICDLDGVVADSSARFAKAEEAKIASLRGNEMEVGDSGGVLYKEGCYQQSDMQRAIDAYWRTAFTPDLVQLDTLMDGVLVDLDSLISAKYRIVLLTSRPETMRKATEAWLYGFGIEVEAFGEDFGYPLIMKPLSQQYVKTPVWKAGTIEVLARLLQPDDLLVVDDEHAAQLTADLAHLDCLKVMCCTSLAAALRVIGE